MDPYEVLGVRSDASPGDVRRAYLRLARLHHPDGHAAAGAAAVARAERRMQEVNAAWALVGEADARRRHDAPHEPGAGSRVGGNPGVIRPPSGTTWHPRVDDTGWMDDFTAWRDQEDDFVPPDATRSPGRRLVTMAPVLLFAVAVGAGCLGLVLGARTLVAVAFGCFLLSVLLFVAVTLLELRGAASR